MSKKKKRAKGDVPVRQLVLTTGVIGRFTKGVKEGAPEKEALTRLRREWEALPNKGAMVKATVVFCGQERGCLMMTFCAHGRYSDNYIIGTPNKPVSLREIELTELSVGGAAADFSRGGSVFGY